MLPSLLRKGLFDLLSANFLIQFLGFGTLLLIPRFITPAELGEIKIIQTFAAFFLILAGFGFNVSVLKLCSENRPEEDRLYYLKVALYRTLVATGLTYLLLLAISWTGVISVSEKVVRWLPIYALVLPFSALTIVFASYLQARKQIKEMARAQVMVKLQSVVVIVLATWQFGFQGFILSTIFAYAVGLWPFIRQIGLGFLKTSPKPLPGLFMNMAVFSTLGNGMHKLGKHADLYILGLFLPDATQVGYYSLATIFLLGAGIVTSTIQTITIPYFSERGNDAVWFRRQLVRTQLQTAAVAVVTAFGVHMAAWLVIRFVYEPHYLAALGYLDVLLVFHVIRSSYAIIGTSMISLGVPKYNFYAACVTTPFGLATSYIALQHYGIYGVAWAQVVTAAFTLVVLFITVRHVLNRRFDAQTPPAVLV